MSQCHQGLYFVLFKVYFNKWLCKGFIVQTFLTIRCSNGWHFIKKSIETITTYNWIALLIFFLSLPEDFLLYTRTFKYSWYDQVKILTRSVRIFNTHNLRGRTTNSENWIFGLRREWSFTWKFWSLFCWIYLMTRGTFLSFHFVHRRGPLNGSNYHLLLQFLDVFHQQVV